MEDSEIFLVYISSIEYIEKKFDYLDLTTNKTRYNDALNEIKLLLKSNTK